MKGCLGQGGTIEVGWAPVKIKDAALTQPDVEIRWCPEWH
jgi:hypothetical protein